jgi:hypothetical protein
MRILWLSLFASMIALHAVAEPMDPDSFLRRVSQRLTGNESTLDDYNNLHAAETQSHCSHVQCLDGFFRTYIRQQMTTASFYSEVIAQVFENVGFQVPALPALNGNQFSDDNDMASKLVYRTFALNRPLDELFTSQIVWSANETPKDFVIQDDAHHAESVNMNVKMPNGNFVQIWNTNYSGHPNISGLFSTPNFEQRYWNTSVNSGRKRAAAFYRVLFCNNMFPALDRSGQVEREHAQAMGIADIVAGQQGSRALQNNRHAADKACAKCHDLLEPVTRMMRPLEVGVAKFAIPDKMIVRDGLAQDQVVPVDNLHDMVVKATQQSGYVDCQMNWLTRWIIGRDAGIHPERFNQMIDEFNQNGRKVKTTIENLMMTPEFRGEAVHIPEPPSLTKANAVFSNCYECHQNFLYRHGDGFRALLAKIAFKLNLGQDGKFRIMPPSDHWWAPSSSDIQDVKNWMLEGAPVVQGQRFLTPSEVGAIMTNSIRSSK